MIQDPVITAKGISKIAQKMYFSIKEYFSKYGQIRRKLWIWSHLLKKSLIKTSSFMQCKQHLNILKIKKLMTYENYFHFKHIDDKTTEVTKNFQMQKS